MRLGWLVVVGVLVGCKGGGKPDAAPTLAKLLADAGDTPWKLCTFAKEHADTPEAKQALERVGAIHAKALPAARRSLAEHSVAPELRKGLEAVLDGGAAAPCQRLIGVFIDANYPVSFATENQPIDLKGIMSEHFAKATGWLDKTALAQSIVDGIDEIGQGWLQAYVDERRVPERASFPYLAVSLFMSYEGSFLVGESPYPGIQMMTSVRLVVPDGGDGSKDAYYTVSLGTRAFDPKGEVRWTETRKPSGLDDSTFFDELAKTMLQQLGAPLVGLPAAIGLATPDAALQPFAGYYTLKQGAIEDGCGGAISLGVPAVRIDPMRRALLSEGENRTYPAKLEGQELDARLDVDLGNCPGKLDPERWSLRRKDATTLVGAVTGDYHLEKQCDRACTYRVALELTRATP